MSKGKLQEASKNLKAIVEKTNGLTDLEAKTNELSLERSKELHGVLENGIGRRNVDKTRICKTGKKLYEKITENYEEAQLKDREKRIYIRAASREEKVRNYDYAAELLKKAGLENEVKNYKQLKRNIIGAKY